MDYYVHFTNGTSDILKLRSSFQKVVLLELWLISTSEKFRPWMHQEGHPKLRVAFESVGLGHTGSLTGMNISSPAPQCSTLDISSFFMFHNFKFHIQTNSMSL